MFVQAFAHTGLRGYEVVAHIALAQLTRVVKTNAVLAIGKVCVAS